MAEELRARGLAEPDVVIECTGNRKVWAEAPALVRVGGKAMLFGGLTGGTEVAFSAKRIHYDEVTLMGVVPLLPCRRHRSATAPGLGRNETGWPHHGRPARCRSCPEPSKNWSAVKASNMPCGRRRPAHEYFRFAHFHASRRSTRTERTVARANGRASARCPGEMLVRIRACGICGSDLMSWYVEQKAPFVFGHEPTGDVVAVGEGVTNFKPGDRVVLHHHAPCMQCDICRRGDYVHCPVWRQQALTPGGMAEFAVVAEQSVRHDTHILPENMSYEAGTLVEPLACVVKALNRARFAPGMRVLVIGLGFTGQLFGFLARRRRAATVAGSDTVPSRLALAREHWADEVYDVSRSPSTTESPDAWRSAVPERAFDLVVVDAGLTHAMLGRRFRRAQRRYVAAVRARRAGPSRVLSPERTVFPRSEHRYQLLGRTRRHEGGSGTRHPGDVPATVLISHRFPLKQVAQAYETAQDVHNALKVVVTMDR